jgi:hypothetical protein
MQRYYVATEEETAMYISNEIRGCVVFVCYDDKDGSRRYAGTAFFVQEAPDKETG